MQYTNTPLKGLKRFKSHHTISIRFGKTWHRMNYAHARQLISYLRDMLEGDLIEVNLRSCGCLERKQGQPAKGKK